MVRMRRLRKSAALRDLVREHSLQVDDLILPLFVSETAVSPIEIASMPGVVKHPLGTFFMWREMVDLLRWKSSAI